MRLCMAGREADWGGRWLAPCPKLGNNIIGSEIAQVTIELCDEHFRQVNEAGAIAQPFIGEGDEGVDEFERRYGWRP